MTDTAHSKEPTSRRRYFILLVGSLLGLVASFLQMIEKLVLLKNKNAVLPCNINDLFNCSAVLNAPQSSLFGFPNALMCIVIFSMFTMLALIGLTGGKVTNKVLGSMLGVASFFILFALWFLYTSTFVIGAVCIFCLICFLGLLLIAGSLMQIIYHETQAIRTLKLLVKGGYDFLILASLGIIVVVMILLNSVT